MANSSIFDRDEFKPYAKRWQARRRALQMRKSYYDGSRYTDVRDKLGWLWPRLYRKVKPLFLPLSRAVDIDAGIVPGDWAWPDPDTLEGVTPAQLDAWRLARRQIFDWSGWVTRGVLYVHYGAVFGVSGLKMIDLRGRGEIQIEPVNPQNFLLVESGQYDDTPALAIWIEHRQSKDGPVEYAEVIDPQSVRTFWAGEPAGIEGRSPEYPNELGFVPFVEVRHLETGERLGESTYQKAMPLLDEVNQLASYLAEIIKKHTEPQWVVFGAEPSELEHSGDNVWFVPGTGDVKALVPDVDLDGVLAFLAEIRDNVHGALPELAFDELKAKDQIATATIELQLLELVLKIKRVRPNYDQGLIEALRMAGRAARDMGLTELASLDNENLAFDDRRPVLPSNRLDEIQLESAELALEMERQMARGEGMTQLAGPQMGASE